MKMELNEALDRLNRAGLIVEETTEDALARMAANSNEAIVEEIVEEIKKVRPVKNYYEVDPDDKFVSQQFEIVMENATWEVQFCRSGFSWGGNVYPWRIIQNNNGGFTKVAHSMSGLRSVMKKIKAIQSESVEKLKKAGLVCEAEGDYRQKVVKKLAGIIDRCYDLDDKGHSYANDIASHWEKHIAQMEEKGVDANETAEVLWYVSKHNNLQTQPLYYTYQFYTRHDPDYFKEWTGLNEDTDPYMDAMDDELDDTITFSNMMNAVKSAGYTKCGIKDNTLYVWPVSEVERYVVVIEKDKMFKDTYYCRVLDKEKQKYRCKYYYTAGGDKVKRNGFGEPPAFYGPLGDVASPGKDYIEDAIKPGFFKRLFHRE